MQRLYSHLSYPILTLCQRFIIMLTIMNPTKRRYLLILLVMVGAIFLLASGLSDIGLNADARPAPRPPGTVAAPPALGGLRLELPPTLAQALKLVLIWIVMPLSIFYALRSRESRLGALRDALILAALLGAFYVLTQRLRGLDLTALTPDWVAPGGPGDSAPTPDEAWVMAVSLGLALLVGGLGWFIWRRLRRAAPSSRHLADGPRAALAELDAGGELRSVILRCYNEMSRAVSQQRGLHRPQGMTAREFEQALAAAGLPAGQVRRLTRLFEGARYSLHAATPAEEREARDCLTAIVAACEARS